ncbi:probable transcription factor At1g11510 [Rosa rugosa]|uniref:probable transcription factor At1g11510 n=1 Tax=Rosa rugosa TaxID=74645 RepID=UPI002B4141B5|nr:probable transcription factor At1g11510 [Rosa rugosa]
MATSQQYRYSSPPTALQFCHSDSDDDDDIDTKEDEQDNNSPSLVGSDMEYQCESDTESESADCSERKFKSSSTKANQKMKSSVRVRVWEEEEEITLLKGLISHKSGNFNIEITKSLPNKSKTQIKDKVRRLKEKCQKWKAGKFASPHEKRLYNLSKKIWGNISATQPDLKRGEHEKKSINADAVGDDKSKTTSDTEDMVHVNDDVIIKAFDEYLLRRSLKINEEEENKRSELLDKWRKVAYNKARHKLAIAEFALELQQYKLDAYNKC